VNIRYGLISRYDYQTSQYNRRDYLISCTSYDYVDLSDNYVDMSDSYVDLSYNYVDLLDIYNDLSDSDIDLSDVMLTCQENMFSTGWHKLGVDTFSR
jgi:5-bromo-4-chloroindolyl phosphate hydrolysis protein